MAFPRHTKLFTWQENFTWCFKKFSEAFFDGIFCVGILQLKFILQQQQKRMQIVITTMESVVMHNQYLFLPRQNSWVPLYLYKNNNNRRGIPQVVVVVSEYFGAYKNSMFTAWACYNLHCDVPVVLYQFGVNQEWERDRHVVSIGAGSASRWKNYILLDTARLPTTRYVRNEKIAAAYTNR